MSFLEALNDPQGVLNQDGNFVRYWKMWKNDETSYSFMPLAEILRRRGFITEAQEICEKGLSHHPESVMGLLVLAKIYRDEGERDRAKDLLGSLAAFASKNLELKELLKEFKIKTPAPTPALEEQKTPETGAQTTPEKPSPWETVTMAEVYANQGEAERGIQICKNLLRRDPKHKRAQELLEQLEKTGANPHV